MVTHGSNLANISNIFLGQENNLSHFTDITFMYTRVDAGACANLMTQRSLWNQICFYTSIYIALLFTVKT